MNGIKLVGALAMGCLLMPATVSAGEREELETLRQTTLAILDALVEKGVLGKEAAEALVKQAQEKGAAVAALNAAAVPASAEATQAEPAKGEPAQPDPSVVRVTYIPEALKREIREQVRQDVVAQARSERWGDVNAVPEWISRIQWEGDIRLRYQGDLFAGGNAAGNTFIDAPYGLGEIDDPINTEEDRHRLRVRARLGMQAKITDSVSAGLRFTTGNTSDPVSTNQTLGNSGNKYSLVVDRAFLTAKPWDWLNLSGGRMPNPFFSTDLVWDDDVNLDGLAASFKPWLHESMQIKPFFTVGAFPIQEVETSPTNLAKDKWLYAAQAGLDWRAGAYSRWRFGLAYYDYRDIAAQADTAIDGLYEYGDSVLRSRQKGNTVFEVAEVDDPGVYGLASDYKLASLTAMGDFTYFDPLHVIVTADVVKNIGYEDDAVQNLVASGYEEQTLGWQAKVTVGKPAISLPGDWQAFVGYRYLERDAVLDAFTDSDFNLGGTNSKGYFIGGSYGLDRNSWLTMKWTSADEIEGEAFGTDIVQIDFNAKF